MFRQLGNMVFDKAFTPSALSSVDEAEYAEHALINQKPRLQPTGNKLIEEEFKINLRAEIVNITETLNSLKKSKDEYEVLPYLKGNGQYIGDFIISSIEQESISELEDGTPVELNLTIKLREFQIPDKLQQQQDAARKNAFAVGDKKPVRAPAPQLISSRSNAVLQISRAGSHGKIVDDKIRGYQNAGTLAQNFANKIQSGLQQMNGYLQSANQIISSFENIADYSSLTTAISNVQSIVPLFTFPINDVTELLQLNTELQAGMNSVRSNATQLFNEVITRRA